MTAPVTASVLADALCKRFEPPEWHVEQEVTLGGRRLDLVAFNLWGARRYRVCGYELKVSRGDWLRELADFEKAEEWRRVVDAFFVVTPAKLITKAEVPTGWGWLELCGSRLMTRVCPRKGAEGKALPRELVARFLTRMVRRVEADDYNQRARLRGELRAEVVAQVRAEYDRARQREREELEQLRQDHKELTDALGGGEWRSQKALVSAAGLLTRQDFSAPVLRAGIERSAAMIGQHHAALQRVLHELDQYVGRAGDAPA